MSLTERFISRCEEAFGSFLDAIAKYGVSVSKDLKVTYEDCFFCYYDLQRKVISFSVPGTDTIEGKLQWYYFMNILGAGSLEEVQSFGSIIIPRTVAHEVAHHLRDFYGTGSGNNWIEEHVANAIAAAYVSEIDDKDKTFLRQFLLRAVSKLGELMGNKRDITASYFELAQILLAEDRVSRKDLDEALSYSKKTGLPLAEVLDTRRLVSREDLFRYEQEQKKESDYFNSRYMVSSVEYGYFHWTWLLAELDENTSEDLGSALNRYILNDKYDSLRREDSRLICLNAIRSGTKQQAEAAAEILCDEIDSALAETLIEDFPDLAERIHPSSLQRIIGLLPQELAIKFCRGALKNNRSGRLAENALVHMHRSNTQGAAGLLDDQLLRGDAEEKISALNVIAALRLDKYSNDIAELIQDRNDGIRMAAWNAFSVFNDGPSDKMKDLIKSGLSDVDPRIRYVALNQYNPENISSLDACLNDADETVRSAAVERLSQFIHEPFEVLRRIDYSYDVLSRLLFDACNTGRKFPRDVMKKLSDWCLRVNRLLRDLNVTVSNSHPLSGAYHSIIETQCDSCCRVVLITWAYANNEKNLLKIIGYVGEKDVELRRYTVDIIKSIIPQDMYKALFREEIGNSESNAETSLAEFYKCTNNVMRALIALGIAKDVFKHDAKTVESLADLIRADKSPLVREVVREYFDLQGGN